MSVKHTRKASERKEALTEMSRAEYIRKLTIVAILLLILITLIALWIRASLTNEDEDIPPVLTGAPEPTPTPPPVNILSCSIKIVGPESNIYTGRPKSVIVMITYEGKLLVRGEDYEVSLSNVENAGKADIIITGIGHYYGTAHYSFQIKKANQDLYVTLSHDTILCGGAAQISVRGIGDIHYSSDNEAVAKVAMYGKVYGKAPGTATITITADGDQNHYAAEKKIKITVTEADE